MNAVFSAMNPIRRRGRRSRGIRGRSQRGAVLFVVLMVLGLLLLAGLGVMRSVDTGNVIAGNSDGVQIGEAQ